MRLLSGDIDQFVYSLEGKKLICFGAGLTLERFVNKYAEYHLEKKISFIVDNDETKHNTIFIIINYLIIIKSIQELLKENPCEIILLITCKDGYSVYEQLKNIKEIKDLICYYHKFINIETRDSRLRYLVFPSSIKKYNEMKIPKKIHYCWFGGAEIPKQNRIWMDSWKRYCPDYEIIEWNEKNYDIDNNQYTKAAYNHAAWAFLSDYVRLDVVYRYGGIYIDTDVEIVCSLDDLLYQEGFSAWGAEAVVNTGAGLGAVKELPIIKHLRDEYDVIGFNPKGPVACPFLQTLVLQRFGLEPQESFQDIEGLVIYPFTVIADISYYYKGLKSTDGLYMIHHGSNSWTSFDNKEQVSRNRILWNEVEL